MPRRIPIAALERLCTEQGLSKAILFAHDGEQDHVVTFGKSVTDADQAAQFGNRLKTAAGWPASLHAEPARVKKLRARIAELEAKVGKEGA